MQSPYTQSLDLQSLSFSALVSQFDNVLIVSQMVRIDETLSCIQKDFTVEVLSVFASLPLLLFGIVDSGFRIPVDNYYVIYTRTFS